jgi:hypothetical protein
MLRRSRSGGIRPGTTRHTFHTECSLLLAPDWTHSLLSTQEGEDSWEEQSGDQCHRYDKSRHSIQPRFRIQGSSESCLDSSCPSLTPVANLPCTRKQSSRKLFRWVPLTRPVAPPVRQAAPLPDRSRHLLGRFLAPLDSGVRCHPYLVQRRCRQRLQR